MNWQSLLPEALKPLASHLELEKVLVDRSATRLLVCFLSDVLVGDREYISLRNALAKGFPGQTIRLRVAAPGLAGAVRADLSQYVPFLTDYMARNAPGLRAMLHDAEWEISGDHMSIVLTSEQTLRYAKTVEMEKRLAELMASVFRIQAEVQLSCKETQDMLEQRQAILAEKAKEAERLQREEDEKAAAKQERPKDDVKILGVPSRDPITPMETLREDSGKVTVRGEVFAVETRELRGGEMCLLTFSLTDKTGSIHCKVFLRYKRKRPGTTAGEDAAPSAPPTAEEIARVKAVIARIREGDWLTVRGDCQYDKFSRDVVLMANDIEQAQKPVRLDMAEEKRVELHMHTQMSSMDGITPVDVLIKQAAAWGHKAVAVTDHGVVQAFPDAFAAAKKNKIKLIPGMEGYLIDEAIVVEDADSRPLDSPIVVLDFETTGLYPLKADRITEIGAVRMVGDTIEEELSIIIDPERNIPDEVVKITGITREMTLGAPKFAEVADKLLSFIGDAPLAAHNARFDLAFLRMELSRMGKTWKGPVVDTLAYARKALPTLGSHKLSTVCKRLGVSLTNAHRAVHDARATAQMLQKLVAMAKEKGAETLADLNTEMAGDGMGDATHIVLLATSQQGMTNLNRLVSEGHLNYFNKRPRLPRALIQRYREGLLVGSACESGELFRAMVNGKDDKTLSQIARFYDYLEIQPIENNAFLLREGRIANEEGLRELNRRVVKLGEKCGLPVVATGDVHFLNPEDSAMRAILMAGKGFDDADEQPPLYFKSTDEMLEEFSYLGTEKAREVVIVNPTKIADRVGEVRLFPKHPKDEETFQPFWETAADEINNTSWAEARARYGDDLPEIVEARLNKELGAITKYQFSTLYSIAEKLVKKSLSDGYLVGSRGSVGSSFVATMCGITEVNPLPPHYRCPKCRWHHFDTQHELATVGPDLPPKTCPACGTECLREGYDIPFEVFLGFNGDKVPDIDLNFSGVYQPRAHKYVEELFGQDNVFRAGTIGTLAEKTAIGYVKKYMEERERTVSEAELKRLALKCVGVKRTTGQHPGGIVVLPKEYEIYQFTAIQHPADDPKSPIITTHYDFGSMHDVLVKLDILGHDDPTMINMLEKLTGVSARELPLTDLGVMSLFTSPEALGVSEEDIRCTTGTLGIPEFGTPFVRGMLEETRPTKMEELVRISGLSHGTHVWQDNADLLVRNGTATLSECICTRDDIMNALMQLGVAPKIAFQTMESVRKGRGLTGEMEAAMRAADTPEWFIDSCKKIEYMFPKGHAVAYVTMALRVAWFKLYRPEAYYTAYYTVRADAFDISLMGRDKVALKEALDDFELRKNDLTAAEKDQQTLAEIALEMVTRGVRLLPINLYKSDAEEFQLIDGQILPPFACIPGLGLAAAQALCQAREAGPFLSIEDVKIRSKVSGTVLEQLRQQGVFLDLPETSQVSLF